MPKANIVHLKITGSAPGAIIDMFHLLVNAKKCIDSKYYFGRLENTLTAVIRKRPMRMIIIMIIMPTNFMKALNSRVDGWLSCAQNGAKESYSPARQSEVAVTLRAG